MPTLIQTIAANKVRKTFGSGDKKRDAGQTTPNDILRFDNILYGNKGIQSGGIKSLSKKYRQKYQLLDVYRPKDALNAENALKKLPLIVSVHGGAWVYGDKDVYQFYCMKLAQRGFAVVNFSYRLAPESKFPASLEDTENVFRWLANPDNAEKYGFDLNNVFAVGDSAGAHLLTLYASAITNKDYAKNYNFIADGIFSDKKIQLRAVALNCGKYNMSAELEKDKQMQFLLSGLMPQKGTKEELDLINAHTHITKDFPPAFVMTCFGDFLYEQAPVICQALEAAGVEHEYHCYGSQEKPLWHVFHCDPKLPEAVTCNDDECAFFKNHCQPIN